MYYGSVMLILSIGITLIPLTSRPDGVSIDVYYVTKTMLSSAYLIVGVVMLNKRNASK